MTETAPIATIIGGSGFVGRYIAQAMAKRGWRVRVACRRPNEALFVKPYGVVGQVEPVQCNVRDDASVARVIEGADAVVYSVGVLFESGRNTFGAIQAEGPERAARLAAEAGVKRFVLISAIGADADSASEYGRTKAAGEAAVMQHFPTAAILRPSIVFGTEDQFFNRFAGMSRFTPALPIVGASTRFQPVWVQDVAEAAARLATGAAEPGLYELGGPNIYTFRELIALTLATIRRQRLVIDLPVPLARMQAWFMEFLPNPPLTRDQIAMLGSDNVVADGAKGFADLGMTPEAPEGIIEAYLVAHRPEGQYSALIEGARARRS